MFTHIDHVGIAVEDLEGSVELWSKRMQLALVHREIVESQGVEAVLLDVGDGHVELLCPLDAQTPVGRFLAKRGPGLHHLAYRVADIDSVLSQLTATGMRLIDSSPRAGIRGSRVAFLHPASTGGVLTEIVEPALEEPGSAGSDGGGPATVPADGPGRQSVEFAGGQPQHRHAGCS